MGDGNHFPIQDPVIRVTHERACSDGGRVLQIATFFLSGSSRSKECPCLHTHPACLLPKNKYSSTN
jgi:hypothetical protein